MADTKLSALTELAVEPADTDEIYVNDGGTSKRITYGTLKTALLARANHTGTQTASTISDFASAVAATSEVTANTAKISADDPALISALAEVTAEGTDYAVILDTSVSPNALKKILISDLLDNATHTGDATGSGALTLQPAAITGKGAVTVAGSDLLLVADVSASPQVLGQVTASSVAALATPEGTAILSTGEVGGSKFLREDGDGTCSWQTVPAGTGDLKADGTVPLTADWDVGSFDITAAQFHSDIATGTAPFTVASTTLVSNLNADLLDGNEATAFATAAQGSAADSALQDVVDDLTPTLGGDLDANGQNVTNLGDVTFQTGAAGGTLRTGTSNADKFQLQAYDVNDATYRTLIEADAGNDVRLQIPADYLDLEDATDPTKIARFDISGVATGTTRTITMPDANVDLGAIATNTAKVTNATHSGDAVGDGALTLQPAAITGKGAVAVDGADLLLVTDVSASPQVLGQVTAQAIANLAPAVQGSAILSSDTSPLVTDGYVLTADGAGGAAWEAAAGGGWADMTEAVWTASGTTSGVTDGASAVGFLHVTPSYTTAGAKLASWKNSAAEKAYITKDGNILSGAGSAGAPAFALSSDPDTGFYCDSNTFRITAGGSQVLSVNYESRVLIRGSNPYLGIGADGAIYTAPTGTNFIAILNGTNPSSVNANTIAIAAKDSSDGTANSTLSLITEQAVEAIGTFTASHKLKIWINGVEYWIQLDAV